MVGHLRVNPGCLKQRWLCYVDLLGFSNLVKYKNWIAVFTAYSKAIDTLSKMHSYKDLTQYVWFSDTFILYTQDDTAESYISIEQKARHFVYFLIRGEIPLRGSISFGEYYADVTHGIYFGKALIEAYKYGEAQDWIGLIQCPSVIQKLPEYGLDVRKQMNFPFWNVPFKDGTGLEGTELPAYRIGEHAKVNGRNVCLATLKGMSYRSENKSSLPKYNNTIDFLEKNQLHFVVDDRKLNENEK